ncbi:hypothetical protein [Streptomyces sp. G45]|uniref:hypothetical protein n=1 Tax=Streptomyces sp. G45 TaxID=3406627 RepID=UPI003C2537D8
MTHPAPDPAHARPGPAPRRPIPPGTSVRPRRWAATVGIALLCLLSLLCGSTGAATTPATPRAAATPPALAAPEPPAATAETRDRALADGETHQPPPQHARGRTHSPSERHTSAATRARPAPGEPSARTPPGPRGPRPAAARPTRPGAEVLVLHCVARS